ncbi:MAG: Spy/CpxP family protein refolding chaperone [Pseudomonadota bacterium]
MLKLIDRPSRALAATVLFGALILAVPSQAQTSTSSTAPSAPMASQPPVRKAAAKPVSRVDMVGQRIKELHTKLRITPDQEAKWATVAQVMQDNAAKVDSLTQQRTQNLGTMTAVDDLKSYRDITQAHADGLQALITAFEGVYDTMTPDQKKNADNVFAQAQGRRAAARKPKAS